MNKLEAAQEYVRQTVEATAACALRIRSKIESGEYALEDVPCFCGAKADKQVETIDRYGIPLSTVICQECALVRVNPRLTQEAFTKFYNTDYRTLNHARTLSCDISSEEEVRPALYRLQNIKGSAIIKRMIEQAIPAPKVVVDYGCHLGGMLKPFVEHFNADVWGVEIDETSAAFAREHGGVNVVRKVEELAEKGLKADFIIMMDVIEHLTDLNELKKLGQIMHKDSFLYVYTPGMFRVNFHANKQIAHTYYFCANTLHWVMAELGFEATYIDEDCHSFWQWRPQLRTTPKMTEWVEYQCDEIEGKEYRKMPPFSGVCKFTKEELYENMRQNFAKHIPDLHDIAETQSGGIAMISGGPSIEDQVDTIRDLQKQGVKIMSILRMYPWCVDKGIIPDYVVSLDCTDDQKKGFEKKVPGVTYLMASVTKPSFFDLIEGEKVYIFDARNDRKIQDMRREAGYTWCTMVNGGGSVSICAMSLAFNLGFTDFHIFGLDLMVKSTDKTHAEGIAGKSIDIRPMEMRIGDEDIITTAPWYEFAGQALDLISVGQQEGCLNSVTIYGDSLIKKLWDGTFHTEDAA